MKFNGVLYWFSYKRQNKTPPLIENRFRNEVTMLKYGCRYRCNAKVGSRPGVGVCVCLVWNSKFYIMQVKAKLSLILKLSTTRCRSTGEWRCSSTHSSPPHYVEVSWLQVPDTPPPPRRKVPRYPLDRRLGEVHSRYGYESKLCVFEFDLYEVVTRIR
jgi:hypothetical protein